MIYLDNNATTLLSSEAFQAMLVDLKAPPYNPSSLHRFGQAAYKLLLNARERIAALFHVLPDEVIFTSSATEALNMAMRSFAGPGKHIITSDLEHSALYNTALSLQKEKTEITFLSPKQDFCVSPESLKNALKPHTSLIALGAVNSETGSLNDLEKLAAIAEQHNIPFLVDGVALLGKKQFSLPPGVTAISFSGHKIHGPKGSGFLIFKKTSAFRPLITGGAQENGKRAGTENLAGILGLAKAVEMAFENLNTKIEQIEKLRNLFEKEIFASLNTSNFKNEKTSQEPLVQINGGNFRICNVSNLAFKNVLAEEMLILLDQMGIAASHGSACSARSLTLSRVLLNMGYDRKRTASSIRFSLSSLTTEKEIRKAVEIIVSTYQKLSN